MNKLRTVDIQTEGSIDVDDALKLCADAPWIDELIVNEDLWEVCVMYILTELSLRTTPGRLDNRKGQ